MLTKEEIGRELSPDDPLSVRSVERYINIAGVKPAVKGGGAGRVAKFLRSDVEKIKAAYKAAAEVRDKQTQALAAPAMIAAQLARLPLPAIIEALRPSGVPVESKLFLTIREASMLSGLSQKEIREAIKGNSLKSRRGKRGALVVSREALNLWARML
ncbi:MAG: hypothetical protein H0W99_00090 [Acidobacteria bacterium]|nr:hypothetical protein [Acidobacteriota bacterium]